MSTVCCKVVIVGDEILSGKRKDVHLQKSIELLTAFGMRLEEASYLPDDPARLVASYKESLNKRQIVFSFGGIGATPDDYTRDAAAAALGVSLALHPEGVKLLEEKFGEEAYPFRIKMVEFPIGSKLIPNPFNQIPGFSVDAHYFFPGFPQMAAPMMEWVLKTYYSNIQSSWQEHSIRIADGIEGVLTPLMQDIVKQYPDLKLFSLPRYKDDGRREVELGLKGENVALIEEAMLKIHEGVTQCGYQWSAVEKG